MGGNGSVSSLTGTIPIEKRAFHRIDTIKGIKVLEHNTLGNAKTPVECNTPNSVYAIFSKKAGIIKHVLFFDGHYLKRTGMASGSANRFAMMTTIWERLLLQ